MQKKTFILLLTFVLTQSCISQNTYIFKNPTMDSLVIKNIKYFDKVNSFKKVEIKQNIDTLFILNYKTIVFLNNKNCSKYKDFNIIVDNKQNNKLLHLTKNEECPMPSAEFDSSGEYNLYGAIYLVLPNEKSQFKEIIRGDFKVLKPYLKSFEIKKVPMPEPITKPPHLRDN